MVYISKTLFSVESRYLRYYVCVSYFFQEEELTLFGVLGHLIDIYYLSELSISVRFVRDINTNFIKLASKYIYVSCILPFIILLIMDPRKYKLTYPERRLVCKEAILTRSRPSLDMRR